MNIRSLTVGAALPVQEESRAALIRTLGSFAQAGRGALQDSGFEVQTTRLSTQPAETWLPSAAGDDEMARVAAELGSTCEESGLDYCSLGTIQAAEGTADEVEMIIEDLPDILMAAPNLFASVQVADRKNGERRIEAGAVRASARIIHALAAGTPNGFGNLRFAAAANCPPHIPFFPASYYAESKRNGGMPEFGLALEAADLAVRACEGAQSSDEARANLLALLIDQGGKAAEICAVLAAELGYTFTGLDISMAPYPTPDKSIGRAIEMLSGVPFGATGTLSAAAFVTEVLREARASLPTVGYSGLMLPALEDSTLAERAKEGWVTLDTLLLMSAVCGLGLDTVPLPGDATESQLERIILDVASLAVRLDKPLTARLMPVPGKNAGDPAEWPDFPYFADGSVFAIPGDPGASGLLFPSPQGS
jgi:uncharacterized protein (UPF0210 family)